MHDMTATLPSADDERFRTHYPAEERRNFSHLYEQITGHAPTDAEQEELLELMRKANLANDLIPGTSLRIDGSDGFVEQRPPSFNDRVYSYLDTSQRIEDPFLESDVETIIRQRAEELRLSQERRTARTKRISKGVGVIVTACVISVGIGAVGAGAKYGYDAAAQGLTAWNQQRIERAKAQEYVNLGNDSGQHRAELQQYHIMIEQLELQHNEPILRFARPAYQNAESRLNIADTMLMTGDKRVDEIKKNLVAADKHLKTLHTIQDDLESTGYWTQESPYSSDYNTPDIPSSTPPSGY
jgi:hypothetical protein